MESLIGIATVTKGGQGLANGQLSRFPTNQADLFLQHNMQAHFWVMISFSSSDYADVFKLSVVMNHWCLNVMCFKEQPTQSFQMSLDSYKYTDA